MLLKSYPLFQISILLGLLVFPFHSFACYCKILNIEESFKKADIVFIGRVVKDIFDFHQENIKENGEGNSKTKNLYGYLFQTLRVYKQENKESLKISRSKVQICPPSFLKNETYVVYASYDAKSKLFFTNACQVSEIYKNNLFLTNHGEITLKQYEHMLDSLK